MPDYPIVVRELGGRNRLGVEGADDLEANVRPLITDGYKRIDVEERDDGEQVGTVVAAEDGRSIRSVRWDG